MNETYIDTIKMCEKGQEILEQVEELKLVIETMFNRIENMPSSTLEWTGESSQLFVNLANKDKVQYNNYANDLYRYGKYLIDCAEYMEKVIKEVRRYNNE